MIIKVKVHASSSCEEIIKISNNEYKVYLKKPPVDNKANIHLLKLLKRYFKIQAKIIKGFNSKEKIIKIGD